jgi:esterase/lipase
MPSFPQTPLLRKREFRIALVVLLVLGVVYGLLYVLLSRGKELDARHRRADFNETFDFANASFADYIAWSERRIRAARGEDANAAVINGLLPFRLDPGPECAEYTSAQGYRAGIVLTHDVLDSPYTQRKLAEYMQSRCLLVFGLLLPGHGSQPGALLQTTWEDWAVAESFAVRELAKEAEYLYLGGHGAGGTLAIREAATNADIDGLLLFAPQLDAPLSAAWTAGVFGWLIPGARWAEVVPAYTAYRYESRPWRLDTEVSGLVAATMAALPARAVEIPVFTIASQEDTTVSTPAILAYMAERVHPLSATLLYAGEPIPEAQAGRKIFPAFRERAGILSLSHLGLMLPLEDAEFGLHGLSRDCGHYYHANREAYLTCMAGERQFLGEISPEHLAKGVVERVEFNPFFYDLWRDLDRFFAPVALLTGETYEPR